MPSIVNPLAGHTPATTTTFPEIRAPRSLTGTAVVLFGNNKPNVDIFFEELARCLDQGQRVKDVGRAGKLSAAFPAPPDVLDKLASYQLAVNAVGD